MGVYTHLAIYCVSFMLLFVILSMVALSLNHSVIRSIEDIVPEQRVKILGVFAFSPLLISSMTSSFLFSPIGNQLIDTHCHLDECGRHIPFTSTETWLFSIAPISILLGLMVMFLMIKLLRQHWQQSRLWRKFSSNNGGYYLIDHESPVAFTLGLFKPDIYISKGLVDNLQQEDINVVIQHETAHIKRHDNFFRLVVSMSTVLFFKNARAHLIEQFNLAQEMACDNYAAKKVKDKLTVAQTLLKVNRCVVADDNIALCGIKGDGTKIEQRIRALLDSDNFMVPAFLLPLLLTAVFLIPSLLTDPVHHIIEHLLRI